MKTLLTTSLLALTAPALGQPPSYDLYVSVLETRGYIVGWDNAASGLYRYEGEGAWTHLGWSNTRNFGIDIDPSNPDRIYLACGNGVIRSADGGKSWRIVTGWRITEVLDIALDRQRPDRAYIATAHGVWRSEDGGDTWIDAGDGIQRPRQSFTQAIEVDVRRSERVLVGTDVGLFESTDASRSWHPIGPREVPIRDLKQSAAAPEVWIAGTEDRGVLLSDDDGVTWRFAAGDIARETVYAVAIDPADPRRMAAAGYETGVYLSDDGGQRWRKASFSPSIATAHALRFDPVEPGRLWVGTVGGGVFTTSDAGLTWRYEGLEGAVIYDIIFIEKTP